MHCDTEVIPHLYERYGVDFPTRLRGMFAIAVWDAEKSGRCWCATVSASSRSTMRSPAALYGSRSRIQGVAGEWGGRATPRPRCAGCLPRVRLRSRPDDAGLWSLELLPGHRLIVERAASTTRPTGHIPRRGTTRSRRAHGSGRPARDSRRVGGAAVDERRAAWRDAEWRSRLESDRCAHGPQHQRFVEDVLLSASLGAGNELGDAGRVAQLLPPSAPITTRSSSIQLRTCRLGCTSASGISTSPSPTSRRSASLKLSRSSLPPRSRSLSRAREPTSSSAGYSRPSPRDGCV